MILFLFTTINQPYIIMDGAGFSGLLKEYEIAPVASANPAGSSGIDMSEIPPPALEKYVPWDYGNQPVNGALPPIPNIRFTQPSFRVKSKPGIREPIPAHHYNPDYWLTHPPVAFFNPQDSGPVAVVNSLNLNQATSNNQSTQTEEITDGSSSIIEHQGYPAKSPLTQSSRVGAQRIATRLIPSMHSAKGSARRSATIMILNTQSA